MREVAILGIGQTPVGEHWDQIVKAVQQLRGESGENKISGVKIGMTQNIGGSGSNITTRILKRM